MSSFRQTPLQSIGLLSRSLQDLVLKHISSRSGLVCVFVSLHSLLCGSPKAGSPLSCRCRTFLIVNVDVKILSGRRGSRLLYRYSHVPDWLRPLEQVQESAAVKKTPAILAADTLPLKPITTIWDKDADFEGKEDLLMTPL
jgi:hypothetical protein